MHIFFVKIKKYVIKTIFLFYLYKTKCWTIFFQNTIKLQDVERIIHRTNNRLYLDKSREFLPGKVSVGAGARTTLT